MNEKEEGEVVTGAVDEIMKAIRATFKTEEVGKVVGKCPLDGGNIVVTCKCGSNASCKKCGYGYGKYPCECRPADSSNIVGML